ncbi:hypothetical protein BC826DRAFT_989073 [Russula brevipes]|nr:hypothetical protein BC826DRAFT_989073 [Russula brevipes]
MKKPPTADHFDLSLPDTAHISTPEGENPTSENGVNATSSPMPLPAAPSDFLINLAVLPPPEMMPAINPLSDKLTEAWEVVKDDKRGASTSRKLDIVGDAIDTTQSTATPFIPIVKATVAAAKQTNIGQVITEGINGFSEGMPVLMKALDELKTLHPFIGVVVLAFQAVYKLDQKRRNNDKKVILLYLGMKDIMNVLLLLKDMEDDKLTAPNGMSIEDRLKSLVERTADDIKECSNVCDAYTNKNLLAKVLLGSVWDAKLLDFVKLFALRRREFVFELTVHTSRGVDKANAKLDAIGDATRALDEQMNAMRIMFQLLVSPEQKQLSALVETKGGVQVLRDDDKMLLDLENELEVDDLRDDIFEDPSTAANKNRTVFSRRFEAQKNYIADEFKTVVQRESDRVIRELNGRAAERILDQLIHDIWVEMGWRGNVKARHFVLALRDHYLEELTSENVDLGMDNSAISSSSNPDAWAIKFIDIMWVQPILEAFDDDASGFITVSEVNRFTSSRPADWSLPHWLAFWAVGFKWSIIDYAKKIEHLFAKMEGVRIMVLPPNREAVDLYFKFVWAPVHTLTAAVLSLSSGIDDSEKFKSYLEAEEARLGKNLEGVNYVIDGIDTLTLITGVGRIEKTVFPLLYLLMKRHYEIMRIMRSKVVSLRDLTDGIQGIQYVRSAITYRVDDLINNFSQQRLDPEKQFQSFAYGIFKYFHDKKALWSVDYIRTLDPQVLSYNNDIEDQNVRPEDILNHEYKDELSLEDWVYDGHSTNDIPSHPDVDLLSDDILGLWHGYLYDGAGDHGEDSMMTFVLVPAEGERNIRANGWSLKGRYTIAGSWSKGEDDMIRIKFKISFLSILQPIFFGGSFDPERDALTGVWGNSAELQSAIWKFECRRILPRYLTVYPSIRELSNNKPRALWRFAIAAVQGDVRRNHWSWPYFSRRRDDREAIVSLLVRVLYFGSPLTAEEVRTLWAIARRLTSADACFYHSKAEHIGSCTWIHENAWCDSCRGRIGGARLFCLDCTNKNTEVHNSVDLCCASNCIDARVTHRKDLERAHEPNHRLVKARTTVLERNHGRAHTAACKAFERVGDFCKKIAEFSPHLHKETRPDEQKASSPELTSAEMPAKNDKPDDAAIPPDRAEDGAEVQDKTIGDVIQPQVQHQDLPTCGKCNGHLSFPFWYCIFCEDNLFICDACDADGVPDLVRSSGKHTEGHHLVRCQAPKTPDDEASPTEQRLTSIEGRLDGMQTQLDGLNSRIEQILHRLAAGPESAA